VFNGEIYNHRELRAELQKRGHQFETDHSDTETILLGYREWGPKVVEHLNGMWAFVIYDALQSILFCSRDRFGEKPLYYSRTNGSFVFASELTSLTEHPAVPKNVSRRALRKYFGYGYIPSPLSILDGVSKLPAGSSLYVDLPSLNCRVERYWDLVIEPFETIPRNPEDEWGQQLRELLDRAVQRRLLADVPVGVFLSGGIDSSAVTAFASRHVAAGRLKTFSVGFDEKSFDETKFAKCVSANFKTDHHVETLSVDRARELTEDCVKKLDEPMADSSLLPTSLVSGFARKQVTVALGGDGGDELFAGYDPFLALKRARFYHAVVPHPIHAAIKTLFDRFPVSHSNLALDFRIKRALRGLDYEPRFWLPTWMAPLDMRSLQELFSERIDIEDLYSEAIELWETCPQKNLVDRTLQFYTKLYLQNDILTKVDRASMAHSLEVRAPFLDIDLVNFVRRIPSDFKLRHGTTKYILKKALDGILPDKVLFRSKKGFGIPAARWFRTGTIDSTRFPMLNTKVMNEKLTSHSAGRSDEAAFLWSVRVLAKWGDQTGSASIAMAK